MRGLALDRAPGAMNNASLYRDGKI